MSSVQGVKELIAQTVFLRRLSLRLPSEYMSEPLVRHLDDINVYVDTFRLYELLRGTYDYVLKTILMIKYERKVLSRERSRDYSLKKLQELLRKHSRYVAYSDFCSQHSCKLIELSERIQDKSLCDIVRFLSSTYTDMLYSYYDLVVGLRVTDNTYELFRYVPCIDRYVYICDIDAEREQFELLKDKHIVLVLIPVMAILRILITEKCLGILKALIQLGLFFSSLLKYVQETPQYVLVLSYDYTVCESLERVLGVLNDYSFIVPCISILRSKC